MVELNKAARNERRKLTATFTNGLAIAIFAIGGFTPIVVAAQQVTTGQQVSAGWGTVLLIAICFCLVAFLHYAARFALAGIEE